MGGEFARKERQGMARPPCSALDELNKYAPTLVSRDSSYTFRIISLRDRERLLWPVRRLAWSDVTAVQTSLDLGLREEPAEGTPAAGRLPALPRLLTALEPKGVVYTRPWVAELILDLAGYRPEEDLAARYAVEPSAGAGAFLVPMIRRLLASLTAHDRDLSDARTSIRAYELDADSAARAVELAERELLRHGVNAREARELAEGWVSVGDYLLTSPKDRRADVVVGNPPYIRYDDLPAEALAAYRRLYPAMVGRCDIYVGFIEAGLRQLTDGGALGFICADRWMRSAYGSELRRIISAAFGIEAVIEMHDAPAFDDEVAAGTGDRRERRRRGRAATRRRQPR